MATKIETARLLTYKAAWNYDLKRIDPKLTSMAKMFAGRTAVEVADEAIQIFGVMDTSLNTKSSASIGMPRSRKFTKEQKRFKKYHCFSLDWKIEVNLTTVPSLAGGDDGEGKIDSDHPHPTLSYQGRGEELSADHEERRDKRSHS